MANTPPGSLGSPTPQQLSLIRVKKLDSGTLLHRVHPNQFGATAFNPTSSGSARFSPITDDKGQVIPTIYSASSYQSALMETVFHDISLTVNFQHIDVSNIQHLVYSKIIITNEIKLADFTRVGLLRIGVDRIQMIDSPKCFYQGTREWAAAIHAQRPDLQGIYWVSRQDDQAWACILFEDRLGPNPVVSNGGSDSIISGPAEFELYELAETLRVSIT